MAVKIIIKRMVPEEKTKKLNDYLRQLRTLTLKLDGYVSGETLKRIDKPGYCMVISTWRSMDDWRKWVLSKERAEIQDKIDELLGVETEYEIYTNE